MTDCIYGEDESEYLCFIDEQKNIADPITLKGKHWSGKSNRDVKRLQLNNCDFVTFPKNLQELYPNLRHLVIRYCNLEHIGTEHIGKLKKMTHIVVINCKLRRLDGDLLSGLEELGSVNFFGNEIEEIEPEIINDLKRMMFINFQNNTNIDNWYAKTLYGCLGNLFREIRVNCAPKSLEHQRLASNDQQKNENSGRKKKSAHEKIKKLQRQIELLTSENAEFKMAQQNQNTLLDEHKKTIEELREKNACLSQQLVLLSDLTIIVGDSIFKVNKAMFMDCSPVIADLLKNNPETQELTLKDVKESTFKAIHDFINTDQLPDTADHLEVFTAAAKLKMEDLKKEAAVYLLANIDEHNCFEVLVMSNKFQHDQLQQKAFEIIRTKIFPDRKLKDELMNQPEKLRKLIEAKRIMEEEFKNL
jgi:hypothetical protein